MLKCAVKLFNPVAGVRANPPWPLKDGLYMPPNGNVRSPLLVVALFVVTFGMHYFWWMYLTCRHARDHARNGSHPTARALTQLIPIYRIFRLYAHINEYKRLADKSGTPTTLSPLAMACVGIYLELCVPVTTIMAMSGMTALPLILNLAMIPLAAGSLAWAQGNMNAYWTHFVGGNAAKKAQITPWEAVYCVGFAALTLLSLFIL